MTFTWHAAPSAQCEPDCRDWVAAVGVITSDTPTLFDKFAQAHDLKNTTVVLDSSGGSVLDALAMGRTWRAAGLRTTVGSITAADGMKPRTVSANAYCESMCVFLLLGGTARSVPNGAHVRVHQIWMGDRANDAKAASYSAQDMTIVERDVGRLAKYTFEMGGSGELLALALSVPPWEPLHELSVAELRIGNLVTDSLVADVDVTASVKAASNDKPVQSRFVSDDTAHIKSTKTAEALPTGGSALASPGH